MKQTTLVRQSAMKQTTLVRQSAMKQTTFSQLNRSKTSFSSESLPAMLIKDAYL